MTKIRDILFLFLLVILATGVVSSIMEFRELSKLRAQQPKITQTDYKDIATRQRADRDIWNELRRINRQTQADTLLLTSGNTIDTVYLDNKYSDKTFVILLCDRDRGGSIIAREVYPFSDSSFVITKGADDVSVVQWMTISK